MKTLPDRNVRRRWRRHRYVARMFCVLTSIVCAARIFSKFTLLSRGPVWVDTRAGLPHAMPIGRFECTSFQLALRAKANSYAPTAGFCLCNGLYTTAHQLAPKFPVRCKTECTTEFRYVPTPTANRPSLRTNSSRDDACEIRRADDGVRELFQAIVSVSDGMPVKGTPNRRRHLHEDFVASGARMPIVDRRRLRDRLIRFIRDAPPYREGCFKGRGIVIAASAFHVSLSTGYWITLESLRRAGCELPVEIWFPRGDIPTCSQIKRMRELGATARAHEIVFVNRFAIKLVSVLLSGFDDVLYLDADQIVLRNPSSLFTSIAFERTGALLWRDFWMKSVAPDIYDVLPNFGALVDYNGTHESGQFLVSKSRVWSAFCLALFFNAHATNVFSPLATDYMGWGDKEFMFLAFVATNSPFGRIEKPPEHLGVRAPQRAAVYGNAMLQLDDMGEPMFLHANIGKMIARDFPTSFDRYNRRWPSAATMALLARATGELDFERWLHGVIIERIRDLVEDAAPARRALDARARTRWFLAPDARLSLAPLLEGMFLDDHPGRCRTL